MSSVLHVITSFVLYILLTVLTNILACVSYYVFKCLGFDTTDLEYLMHYTLFVRLFLILTCILFQQRNVELVDSRIVIV